FMHIGEKPFAAGSRARHFHPVVGVGQKRPRVQLRINQAAGLEIPQAKLPIPTRCHREAASYKALVDPGLVVIVFPRWSFKRNLVGDRSNKSNEGLSWPVCRL